MSVVARVRRSRWTPIVALVIASRVVLSCLGVVSGNVLDDVRPAETVAMHAQLEAARADISASRLFSQWYNWDALHYENLSRSWFEIDLPLQPSVVTADGHEAWGEFSWPPLYPWAIGLLHLVFRLDAGQLMLLINLVLFAVLLWLVRAREEQDGRPGGAAMLAVVAAPFSFFLSSALSEPLFVVLAAWSLLMLRRQRWGVAGLAAGLAAWTRNAGVYMTIPLAVAALVEHRRRRGQPASVRLVPWLAPALSAGGFVTFRLFAWALTGTPRAPELSQRYGWGNSLGNPFTNLMGGITHWQYAVVAAMLMLVIVLAARGHLCAVEATYCAVMLLAACMVDGLHGAAPRFVAVAFPIFPALARWAGQRGGVGALVATSGAIQGAMFVLWTNYWLTAMF